MLSHTAPCTMLIWKCKHSTTALLNNTHRRRPTQVYTFQANRTTGECACLCLLILVLGVGEGGGGRTEADALSSRQLSLQSELEASQSYTVGCSCTWLQCSLDHVLSTVRLRTWTNTAVHLHLQQMGLVSSTAWKKAFRCWETCSSFLRMSTNSAWTVVKWSQRDPRFKSTVYILLLRLTLRKCFKRFNNILWSFPQKVSLNTVSGKKYWRCHCPFLFLKA